MKNIIRKLKMFAKVVVGKEFFVKPDVVCATERFGTKYGGWDIVVANITTSSIIYSFGIGEDASFDTALNERFNLTIHAFNPPENPDHVSHTLLDRVFSTKTKSISVQVKRLSTIMKELGHNHIDVIKMDIEGAEYDVIDNMSKSNVRPHQILVEFHHRFPCVGIKRTKEAILTLRSMGYGLFSVSSTNEEFCFVRMPSQHL